MWGEMDHSIYFILEMLFNTNKKYKQEIGIFKLSIIAIQELDMIQIIKIKS